MTPTYTSPVPSNLQQSSLHRLGGRPGIRNYLREIWDRRDFALTLPAAKLQVRNANTLLGSFWHLLNPLLLGAAYFVVFGIIFDARSDVDNYVGFLLIGLFVFYYSHKCLTGGAATITANGGIIRNVNLPRAVFPIGSVIGETLAHLPALGLLVVAAVVTGEQASLTWLLLAPLFLLQGVFNLGLSFWIGRLTYHVRDIRNILPLATRMWLYMSGVFFTADRVPAGLTRDLFELNPLHVFIQLHRDVLLDARFDAETWLSACAWSVVLLVSGFAYFWRREGGYGLD